MNNELGQDVFRSNWWRQLQGTGLQELIARRWTCVCYAQTEALEVVRADNGSTNLDSGYMRSWLFAFIYIINFINSV